MIRARKMSCFINIEQVSYDGAKLDGVFSKDETDTSSLFPTMGKMPGFVLVDQSFGSGWAYTLTQNEPVVFC